MPVINLPVAGIQIPGNIGHHNLETTGMGLRDRYKWRKERYLNPKRKIEIKGITPYGRCPNLLLVLLKRPSILRLICKVVKIRLIITSLQ
jgi:hypothetical protein